MQPLAFRTRFNDLDDCIDTYTEWYVYNESRVPSFEAAVEFLRLALNGRTYILHLLRDELMSLRQSRSDYNQLDKALDEYTAWHATNAETITDPVQFVAFAKKALDDSLHLLFLMRDELRAYEQKTPAVDSLLYLPTIYR